MNGYLVLSLNSDHLKGCKDAFGILLPEWTGAQHPSGFLMSSQSSKNAFETNPNQKRLKVSLKRFQRISPLDNNNTLYVFTTMPNTKQT